MKQCREIQKNWIGLKNFDICFCVTFEQQYNSFTFGRATGFQAPPPPIFEVFPVSSYFFKTFPKLSSNSCILHKISSTTLLVANRSYPKILKILKILKFSLFMRAIKHSGKLCFYCCWSVRQGIQIYKQSPAKEFFAKFVSYFWQKMSPWAFEMVVNTPLLFLSQKKKTETSRTSIIRITFQVYFLFPCAAKMQIICFLFRWKCVEPQEVFVLGFSNTG